MYIDIHQENEDTLRITIDGKDIIGRLHIRSRLIVFEADANEFPPNSMSRDWLEETILPDLFEEIAREDMYRRVRKWQTYRVRYYKDIIVPLHLERIFEER